MNLNRLFNEKLHLSIGDINILCLTFVLNKFKDI